MILETFLELGGNYWRVPPSITYNSLHFPSLCWQLGWRRGEIFHKKNFENYKYNFIAALE